MDENNKILGQFNNKCCFAGVSLGSSSTNESGIAVLDSSLNLVRIDKAYDLEDLQLNIKNLAPKDNLIVCIDLPRNATMINGKWRLEAKNNKIFNLNSQYESKQNWTERFSDRGTDLCRTLNAAGFDIFRYNCYFTKNALKINPPFKSRSPLACKYLQMIIQDKLKVSGIPSNLIPLAGLDAIIGAYTAWSMATSKENTGYKCIGSFKNLPVITAI